MRNEVKNPTFVLPNKIARSRGGHFVRKQPTASYRPCLARIRYKGKGQFVVFFASWDVLFFAKFRQNTCQNKRFPPSCCFGFVTGSLSRIDQ